MHDKTLLTLVVTLKFFRRLSVAVEPTGFSRWLFSSRLSLNDRGYEIGYPFYLMSVRLRQCFPHILFYRCSWFCCFHRPDFGRLRPLR